MKMKILSAAAAVLLLSGCASKWDVDGAARMAPSGDAFTQALHKNYVERAKFEKGEADWCSVRFFTDRARKAAEGEAVAPQPPSERKLKAETAEIGAAHGKLTAALATTAPKDAPEACARAQAWLEHWMEQQEEGHQGDHIAMARDGFNKAMPHCKPVPVAVAAPAPVGPFMVYFEFNRSDITTTARKTLVEVIAAHGPAKPAKVMVIGHTDTSGSAAYNERLAAKRAAAVAEELTRMGIPSSTLTISSHGKSQPAVATGDNVMEKQNRRVEIRFVR